MKSTIVRPGLSLAFHFAVPLGELGNRVADIVEDYLSFIAPAQLDRYYAPSATYKKLTPRVLATLLGALRQAEPGDDSFEMSFGPGLTVGSGFAVHFAASALAADSIPDETNLLMLEFPLDFFERRPPTEFFEFAVRNIDRGAFDSGLGGWAFQHPVTVFREEATEEISRLAMRYRGLDISFDDFHYDGRGAIYNVSWLNFLGAALIAKFGGMDRLRAVLPRSARLVPLVHGVAIVACEHPVVGDVKRDGIELLPYRELASALKPLRIDVAKVAMSDEEFAERWLGRLDDETA